MKFFLKKSYAFAHHYKMAFLLVMMILLTGCFALPTEAPALPPPVFAAPEAHSFMTIPVMRGDVQMEELQIASYMPVRQERLYFNVCDVPLLGIFVAINDVVQAGDIMAALDMPEIQQELYNLNHRRARLELDLRHVEERLALARSLARASGVPADDRQFTEMQANLMGELAILDMRIEYVSRLDEARYLRASIDGVVNRITAFEEGMLSQTGQVIVGITDSTYTAFVVRGRIAEFMLPGKYYDMFIGDGTYLMKVVDPDEVGFARNRLFPSEAFLIFIDSPPALRSGSIGRVNLASETVYDVLHVPSIVLRHSEYRTFVYVLLDNGLRAVRDVTIGLEGNYLVEIVDGLAEGELVIIR